MMCPPRPTSSLHIGFFNICSLRNKVSEVGDLLERYSIHVLAVAETWLDKDISDAEVAINGYSIMRKDRSDKRWRWSVHIH